MGEGRPQAADRGDAAGWRARVPTRRPTTALATYLESQLDRAAAAHPQLGKLPLVHRLTRTEYQNAIRDLLGLDALPREIRVDFLLPADNISSGFDNIADLLFMSPVTLERYLDAATKISRFAVGDPSMPVLVNIHKIDEEHPQDERVDELPFGTRGGIAVRADFPADADLRRQGRDGRRGARSAAILEITVDGERADLAACRRRRMEIPLPIKAGSHLVGVAFLQRTEARDEGTLRPRTRGRGTQAGARQRHDRRSVRRQLARRLAQPASHLRLPTRRRPADEPACAKRILSTLDAARLPASGDRRRPAGSAAVLRTGPRRRHVRSAASRRRSSGCWSARSSCSGSSINRPGAAPGRRIASAISSWPRGCRSFSGAAFRTTNCWTRRRPGS